MRFGSKVLERVELLAGADEPDRLAGDGAHGERGAAAAVAVHPGQDHAGDADGAVELLGDLDRDLAGQAVDDEQRLARLGDVADLGRLVHQRLVDVQAAGGVEHDDVVAAERRLLLGALRDLHGVLARDDRQRVDADLGAEDGELLHRRRAVGVERGHQHPLALALLEPLGELGGGRGLAAALQADHQDRRRRVVDRAAAPARRRRTACATSSSWTILTTCWPGVTDFVTACAGGLALHPALTKSRATGSDTSASSSAVRTSRSAVLHVVLGQRALLGQPVEDAAQAFGQVLEHRGPPYSDPCGAPEIGRGTEPPNSKRARGRISLTDGDPGCAPRDRKACTLPDGAAAYARGQPMSSRGRPASLCRLQGAMRGLGQIASCLAPSVRGCTDPDGLGRDSHRLSRGARRHRQRRRRGAGRAPRHGHPPCRRAGGARSASSSSSATPAATRRPRPGSTCYRWRRRPTTSSRSSSGASAAGARR